MVKIRKAIPWIWVLLLAPLVAHAGLCVNEIMADPASDWDGDGVYHYKDDEWVELYNSGPAHIDLEDFLLSDDGGMWTYGFEPGQSLAVGEAIVIYGSDSVEWQAAWGHSTYGFQMSNDGDTVVLWEVVDSDTLLVDTHTFNTYEADDDRSTGRDPDGVGDWVIFDALNPYGGSTPPLGNGLAPTPGLPNMGDPPSTPVDRTSWGKVKSLFK